MSEDVLDKRVVDFIRSHHVMTLATTSGLELHCCNLFYAFDSTVKRFAVTSSLQTLHARQAADNPSIAGSIVLESKVIGKLQGLQFTGTMRLPDENEKSAIRALYLKKFPFAMVMDLELWIIDLATAKFTDNNLGFGKKITWTSGR